VTLHETRQYLKYRWIAKGRHGTHSPFVYAFVEDMLLHTHNEGMLIKNILHYFQFKNIREYTLAPPAQPTVVITKVHDGNENGPLKKTAGLTFDRLCILNANPAPGSKQLEQYVADMQPNDVLLIKPLHKTEAHTQQWNELKGDPRVKLSIDLFSMGLLFFRDEFKEKQYFVLKY